MMKYDESGDLDSNMSKYRQALFGSICLPDKWAPCRRRTTSESRKMVWFVGFLGVPLSNIRQQKAFNSYHIGALRTCSPTSMTYPLVI